MENLNVPVDQSTEDQNQNSDIDTFIDELIAREDGFSDSDDQDSDDDESEVSAD